MTAAAFKATYSDFRLIKGRKVVQFVFELPLEQADTALKVVGGMPNPAAECWCAIARLDPEKIETPVVLDSTDPLGFNRLAQRAGILCNDPMFWRFLNSVDSGPIRVGFIVRDKNEAAEAVRLLCKVQSRADIKLGTEAATRLDLIESAFVCWRDAPEMTGAS